MFIVIIDTQKIGDFRLEGKRFVEFRISHFAFRIFWGYGQIRQNEMSVLEYVDIAIHKQKRALKEQQSIVYTDDTARILCPVLLVETN